MRFDPYALIPVVCLGLLALGVNWILVVVLLLAGSLLPYLIPTAAPSSTRSRQPSTRSWRAIAAVVLGLLILLSLFRKPQQREPPIDLTLRASLVGLGHVLDIENTSDRALSQIRISMFNTRTGDSRAYDVPLIGPRGITSVGWREAGWVFEPGELLKVSIAGYREVEVSTDDLFH